MGPKLTLAGFRAPFQTQVTSAFIWIPLSCWVIPQLSSSHTHYSAQYSSSMDLLNTRQVCTEPTSISYSVINPNKRPPLWVLMFGWQPSGDKDTFNCDPWERLAETKVLHISTPSPQQKGHLGTFFIICNLIWQKLLLSMSWIAKSQKKNQYQDILFKSIKHPTFHLYELKVLYLQIRPCFYLTLFTGRSDIFKLKR